MFVPSGDYTDTAKRECDVCPIRGSYRYSKGDSVMFVPSGDPTDTARESVMFVPSGDHTDIAKERV